MKSQIIKLAKAGLVGELQEVRPAQQLVVVCHGYQGSNKDPTIVAITDGLNKSGHNTFTFNFSTNTGGFDIEHQVHDIALIADHFKSYDELVLLAGSFAALTAAIATIQIPKVRGLITLNGFFGQRDLGQEHRKTYIKFRTAALIIPKYRKILKYYKHSLAPGDIKVPVLVIHSKVDKYVFIKQSQDFYERLTVRKQFIELQSANHGVTSPGDRKNVVTEIDKWLSKTQSR